MSSSSHNPPPLRIVVTNRARSSIAAEVQEVAPEAAVTVVAEKELALHVSDAEIIATVRMPPETLAHARNLKWVQSWAAGPNELMYDEFRRAPVILTSCAGNGAVPLAEHAMMFMLAFARDLRRSLVSQAEARWDKFNVGELMGKTVGIIGVGNAGTDLAVKAHAFHMRVLGLRRRAEPAEHFDMVFQADRLTEFLAQCDFVVVTAALTEDSRGLLDESAFQSMKRDAHYICVSRGAIANTEALLRALRENWIAGAGLDAHETEPLPQDSPFWGLPNVMVTPHIGAVSTGTIDRGCDIFLENLRRYRTGRPLLNVVDKQSGY